ncbi:MAG: SRPBCC family protein [Hyphomonadaceae bacterium]
MTPIVLQPNPKLDLVLERDLDVSAELFWKAWTTPEHLMPWFCPRPWTTIECEIDLRPGGIFATTMQSPEGQKFPSNGCYLEVTPLKRLIWTNMLLPGFRPTEKPATDSLELYFTAALEIEPKGKGIHYRAMALHRDPGDRKTHEDMGFHDGWSTCADQLVEYVKAHM